MKRYIRLTAHTIHRHIHIHIHIHPLHRIWACPRARAGLERAPGLYLPLADWRQWPCRCRWKGAHVEQRPWPSHKTSVQVSSWSTFGVIQRTSSWAAKSSAASWFDAMAQYPAWPQALGASLIMMMTRSGGPHDKATQNLLDGRMSRTLIAKHTLGPYALSLFSSGHFLLCLARLRCSVSG